MSISVLNWFSGLVADSRSPCTPLTTQGRRPIASAIGTAVLPSNLSRSHGDLRGRETINLQGRRHARVRYASIADVLLHSSATTLCANKRRVRSADDLSASTGSRRLRGTRVAVTPHFRSQ